jgi:ERF superfamily
MTESTMKTETIDDIIARVAAEIAKVGVGKTGTAAKEQGGYKFRQVVDVLNVVGPIMAAHGLSTTVEFRDRVAERITTKSGGGMTSVTVTGAFTYRWRGETRTTTTIGEGFDAGDKATNKAMSAAAKYAHGLTFNIPFVGLVDSEATNGAKTLNDTGDKSGPATKMSDSEFDAWTKAFATAQDQTELRCVLKDALAKAHEYGDAWAHADLKKAAADHVKRLSL